MANVDLSGIEDDIVTRLATITGMSDKVKASSNPEDDAAFLIPFGYGILVGAVGTTESSDQSVTTYKQRQDVDVTVLIAAPSMRATGGDDERAEVYIHGLRASILDKLHGWKPNTDCTHGLVLVSESREDEDPETLTLFWRQEYQTTTWVYPAS